MTEDLALGATPEPIDVCAYCWPRLKPALPEDVSPGTPCCLQCFHREDRGKPSLPRFNYRGRI